LSLPRYGTFSLFQENSASTWSGALTCSRILDLQLAAVLAAVLAAGRAAKEKRGHVPILAGRSVSLAEDSAIRSCTLQNHAEFPRPAAACPSIARGRGWLYCPSRALALQHSAVAVAKKDRHGVVAVVGEHQVLLAVAIEVAQGHGSRAAAGRDSERGLE